MVVLAFWLTVAAQLLTWFGTSGVVRYALTFSGPLPLLVTAMLARMARTGRLARYAAISLAGALLVSTSSRTSRSSVPARRRRAGQSTP